jgi:hypothetical protein
MLDPDVPAIVKANIHKDLVHSGSGSLVFQLLSALFQGQITAIAQGKYVPSGLLR